MCTISQEQTNKKLYHFVTNHLYFRTSYYKYVSYLLKKALLCCVEKVVVDVAASAVPSAAGPPPSVAATLRCACVGTAAACACGLSCASASEQGRMLSQPACALTPPAERRPAQESACAAAGSARRVELGATAGRFGPD